MAELLTIDALAALATLTTLEIVLGIDNLVFIAILAQRLPEEKRDLAWKVGLSAAAGVRILLLFGIAWLMGLQSELFTLFGHAFSVKDLILIAGGGFLLYKATKEIHHMLAPHALHGADGQKKPATLGSVIFQILLMDMIFSLDSVITAVGMTEGLGEPAPALGTDSLETHGAVASTVTDTVAHAASDGDTTVTLTRLVVMIAAVVIAIGVMLLFAKPLSNFVRRHPPVKMLALTFLVLIGALLVADGFHHHIPRGYIYAAMGFAVFVELLQMRIDPTHKTKPLEVGKVGEPPIESFDDRPPKE
ncbi:MAG: TerC family protein [Planctomycetota bacterium]